MRQKMVIKVQMSSDKCRTKAMKIAAATGGVTLVGIEGTEKDKLVVTGDGIDIPELNNKLRKKVGFTTILGVQQVPVRDQETTYEAFNTYEVVPSRTYNTPAVQYPRITYY